jgi:hypothetical protein
MLTFKTKVSLQSTFGVFSALMEPHGVVQTGFLILSVLFCTESAGEGRHTVLYEIKVNVVVLLRNIRTATATVRATACGLHIAAQ